MSKRAEPRTATFMDAQIVADGRSIACVIRDISAKGARLRVADVSRIPQDFELFMKQAGTSRPARVRWRRKSEIGVAFMPERRSFGRRLVPPTPAEGAPEAT